jgi:hypothetical protein
MNEIIGGMAELEVKSFDFKLGRENPKISSKTQFPKKNNKKRKKS